MATALRLNSHQVEAAQRLFQVAMQHNFIQGRRTQNVVAACLYIVCRREHTPRTRAGLRYLAHARMMALTAARAMSCFRPRGAQTC